MTLELISRGEGRPGRPSLLFIPGAFHDARCWDHHFLPWFAERGWAAHGLSLRGHGGSSGNAATDQPGLADYVEDVRETVARIGGNVVVIGHSMGGVVAQMARNEVQGVAGIVPFASSPLRPSNRVVWRILRRHPVSFFKAQVMGDTDAGRPAFASFFYRDDIDPALKERYMGELTAESPRALREVFSRDVPDTSGTDARPVLVVAGRDDWSIPMTDNEWLAAQYGAPLAICPGAHNLMLDPDWEASAQAIADWLDARFPG